MIVLYGSKMLSVVNDQIIVKDDGDGVPLSTEDEEAIKAKVRQFLFERQGLRGLDGPRWVAS